METDNLRWRESDFKIRRASLEKWGILVALSGEYSWPKVGNTRGPNSNYVGNSRGPRHSKKELSTEPPKQAHKSDTIITVIPIPDSNRVQGTPQDHEPEVEPFVLIERPESEGGNFYIGKYEVTNQEYMDFVEATGHPAPSFAKTSRFNHLNQPVVGVSWEDAMAYCEWRSRRQTGIRYSLPTEELWRLAAYGVEQREFPWEGAAVDRRYANFDNHADSPSPVGSYPNGATLEGVFDMAGNVWEWCDKWYDDAKTERVIRGGAWNASADYMRIGLSAGERPDENKRNDIGFRVVQSVHQ